MYNKPISQVRYSPWAMANLSFAEDFPDRELSVIDSKMQQYYSVY